MPQGSDGCLLLEQLRAARTPPDSTAPVRRRSRSVPSNDSSWNTGRAPPAGWSRASHGLASATAEALAGPRTGAAAGESTAIAGRKWKVPASAEPDPAQSVAMLPNASRWSRETHILRSFRGGLRCSHGILAHLFLWHLPQDNDQDQEQDGTRDRYRCHHQECVHDQPPDTSGKPTSRYPRASTDTDRDELQISPRSAMAIPEKNAMA